MAHMLKILRSQTNNILATENINLAQYIYNSKTEKLFLLGGIIASIFMWIVFKHFYPNPNLIFDSYHYLIATDTNANVYAWPIGYPKFIRLLGHISHAANFLTTCQFFLFESCSLLFFFSIRMLLRIGILPSIILLLYLHLNPIYLYTSNLVISDILFTSLSLVWITQIIWIIYYPKKWMIYTHSIILLLVFTIRYNALYYPFVGVIAILLTHQSIKYKLLGIILPIILITGFILFTRFTMQTSTGVKQFSPFGGWKLANDALYMYEHIYIKDKGPLPEKFKNLDQTVRKYFDAPHDTVDLYHYDVTSGSYYMYIYPSPLMVYQHKVQGFDPSPLNFRTFAPMGPLYQEYGTYLIKKNIIPFVEYFIVPNLYRYFIPPQEVYTDNINPFYLRHDDLDSCARKWFGITSTNAKQKYINFRFQIFNNYSFTNAIIHGVFFLCILGFSLLNGFSIINKEKAYVLLLITLLFLIDFCFSIVAAAIVLRYELFITIIEFSFILVIIEFISNLDNKNTSLTPSGG